MQVLRLEIQKLARKGLFPTGKFLFFSNENNKKNY